MNAQQLELLAAISLIIFCLIGAFDGLYYHYYKYRLHLYKETKLEHYIHGARGILFCPIAFLFFVMKSEGFYLGLGLALVLVDLTLEVFDILVEKEARANLGGISPGESLCHVFATGFRLIALTFVLSAKPMSAFFNMDMRVQFFEPSPILYIGVIFTVTSFLGGVMHFMPLKKTKKMKVRLEPFSFEKVAQLFSSSIKG